MFTIRLIKEMASGAVRFWQVVVNDTSVETSYGFVGNDESITANETVIESGKNIGKITETTAEEEAVRKAFRLVTAKITAGYEFDVDAEAQYDELVGAVNGITERIEEAKSEREAEKATAKAERAEARRLEKEAREAELAQAAALAEAEDEEVEDDLDENDEMDSEDIDA